jgi:glutamate carboxypeptidase
MESIETVRAFLNSRLPSALEMLREMVEINSFTANPDGVNRLADLTTQYFSPLGFSAQSFPAANPEFGNHLVMTRPGLEDRSISMISHLDTVFSPEEEQRGNFHWQPEGDRIFGPGTIDIKGGTTMMWLVLSALQACSPDIFKALTWKLLWNSAEERYPPDFGVLCRSQVDARTLAALVFEAEGRSGLDHLLVVARKGRATWRVTVSGRGSHAGGNHPQGANAIVQLGKTVQQIAALTDYGTGLTFNVGSITGGTVTNRVPHEAMAEGEFRAFTREAYARGRAGLLSLAGQGDVCSPADGFPCEVKVEILNEIARWPRNQATEQLFQIWKGVADEIGMPTAPEERGGVSDGNTIWDVVPTLDGLGPWGDNDHCSERSADGSKLPEFVQISSFVPKALLNTLAILSLAKS